MKLKSYKDLIVWQKSMLLVKEIYRLTADFPREEQFCLTAQMRRAAIGIPSNIAEGYLRIHHKEFIQFLSIALGSAAELETQMLICESIEKFHNIDFSKSKSLLIEVLKMLYTMVNKHYA